MGQFYFNFSVLVTTYCATRMHLWHDSLVPPNDITNMVDAISAKFPDIPRYQSLSSDDIDEEVELQRRLAKEITEEWEEELLAYEQTENVSIPGVDQETRPRRNYFNPEAKVKDTSLFPYHDDYYALLDAYDHFYVNEAEGNEPIEETSVRPEKDDVRTRRSQHEEREGILTTSASSIGSSVLILGETQKMTDVLVEDSFQEQCWESLRDMFQNGSSHAEIEHCIDASRQSPSVSVKDRASILLKLLRHSLSFLQRDHYLASCILTRLCCASDSSAMMEDPDILRRILLLFRADYIPCGHPCDGDLDGGNDDHICRYWAILCESLLWTISRGITLMTKQHALVLAGFFRSSFYIAFGNLSSRKGNVKEKRNAMIRRVVLTRQYNIEDETSAALPADILELCLRALGSRAHLEWRRSRAALPEAPLTKVKGFIKSYWNCVCVLVAIGSDTCLMVPEADRLDMLGSEVVKNLGHAFLAGKLDLPDRRFLEDNGYLQVLKYSQEEMPSVVLPNRYSDIILKSTERKRERDESRKNALFDERTACQFAVENDRPQAVPEVIRHLFMSNMVDCRLAEMGYGDVLVWCGFDMNPLDPALYWYVLCISCVGSPCDCWHSISGYHRPEFQFPMSYESDSDSEDDDSEGSYEPWVQDEVGDHHALVNQCCRKCRGNKRLTHSDSAGRTQPFM